ncbi:hypothetical protein ACH41E_27280 [Streptomyces sp. NPDC020412]|uniref:hypothetical protein n=1 Tax=Streptomyces sp. NPDC020412 TaxID=3365073 RepID=UPI0037968980
MASDRRSSDLVRRGLLPGADLQCDAYSAGLREFEKGALVFDSGANRLGVVMEVCGSLVALRPRGGGIEWDARRENVRAATVDDRLRPVLAELNAFSSRRAP